LLFSRRPQNRGNVPLLNRHSNDDPQCHGRWPDRLWASSCTSECTIHDLCFGPATAESCIIYRKRILYVSPSLGICAVPISSLTPRRYGSSSMSFRSSSSR
jgi:hypothetical protein